MCKQPAVIVSSSLEDYLEALGVAQSTWVRVEENTTPVPELRNSLSHAENPEDIRCYLMKAGAEVIGGFSILYGTLRGLWCSRKGSGQWLIRQAVAHGANYLDCYDGFLVERYAREGFVETARYPNWNGASHPDVVYMNIPLEWEAV